MVRDLHWVRCGVFALDEEVLVIESFAEHNATRHPAERPFSATLGTQVDRFCALYGECFHGESGLNPRAVKHALGMMWAMGWIMPPRSE